MQLQSRAPEPLYQIMLARYFSVGLARFNSVDRKEPDGINPQEWNRYAYVANNPLKYVDPDGMDLVLAGDSRSNYLRFTLAQLYTFPIGAAVIDLLESVPKSIVLGTASLTQKNVSGVTALNKDTGQIIANVDPDRAQTAESLGGNTPAQNLFEELWHSLELLFTGRTGDPNYIIEMLKKHLLASPDVSEDVVNHINFILSTGAESRRVCCCSSDNMYEPNTKTTNQSLQEWLHNWDPWIRP